MTKHDLNNAEPAKFTTSSGYLRHRVCLEELGEEFRRKAAHKRGVSFSTQTHTFLAGDQHSLGKKLLSCGVFLLHLLNAGGRAPADFRGHGWWLPRPPSWHPGRSCAHSATFCLLLRLVPTCFSARTLTHRAKGMLSLQSFHLCFGD